MQLIPSNEKRSAAATPVSSKFELTGFATKAAKHESPDSNVPPNADPISLVVLDEEPVELLSGAWSSDGRFFAVAGRLKESGTSRAWVYNAEDLNQLKLHTTISGHAAGGITAIHFLPDSRYVVTGGNDGACYVWNYSPQRSQNVEAWEAIQLLPDNADIAHSAPITQITVSQSGEYIATASEDNRAIIWPNLLLAK